MASWVHPFPDTQERAALDLRNDTQNRAALESDLHNENENKAALESNLHNENENKAALESDLHKAVPPLHRHHAEEKPGPSLDGGGEERSAQQPELGAPQVRTPGHGLWTDCHSQSSHSRCHNPKSVTHRLPNHSDQTGVDKNLTPPERVRPFAHDQEVMRLPRKRQGDSINNSLTTVSRGYNGDSLVTNLDCPGKRCAAGKLMDAQAHPLSSNTMPHFQGINRACPGGIQMVSANPTNSTPHSSGRYVPWGNGLGMRHLRAERKRSTEQTAQFSNTSPHSEEVVMGHNTSDIPTKIERVRPFTPDLTIMKLPPYADTDMLPISDTNSNLPPHTSTSPAICTQGGRHCETKVVNS